MPFERVRNPFGLWIKQSSARRCVIPCLSCFGSVAQTSSTQYLRLQPEPLARENIRRPLTCFSQMIRPVLVHDHTIIRCVSRPLGSPQITFLSNKASFLRRNAHDMIARRFPNRLRQLSGERTKIRLRHPPGMVSQSSERSLNWLTSTKNIYGAGHLETATYDSGEMPSSIQHPMNFDLFMRSAIEDERLSTRPASGHAPSVRIACQIRKVANSLGGRKNNSITMRIYEILSCRILLYIKRSLSVGTE